MKINWQKHIIWGIKLGELAAFLAVYLFLYLFYSLTLAINESAYVNLTFKQLFKNYLTSQAIDYTLKFILTIPLWYLYFIALKNWSLPKKLFLHNFTAFLFVLCWIKSYYLILESLGRGHLRGTSQIWDIYIPALIYIVQFGFFHAYQYHLEVKRQKALEAELRQANLESELSAIKAQLNPHFLYNVFNTISASVPPEMESTREMIAKLADMFRYQLKASKEDFVNIRDELTFTDKYLALEKDRFGSRLQTQIEVEDSLLEERIPPMILQPIVENAIKHGISPKIEGGTVSINIKKKDDFLCFEIIDTGAGLDVSKEKGHGIGLTNTQLRLEKMFGEPLNLSPNIPSGLKVWFKIPIQA
ncbi:MAG: histidine kinase [Spirosomaceae bacterium]|jgi:sensor histidine kinase YesM|nr:histidine kinase [Spirosomataceae bacterium]